MQLTVISHWQVGSKLIWKPLVFPNLAKSMKTLPLDPAWGGERFGSIWLLISELCWMHWEVSWSFKVEANQFKLPTSSRIGAKRSLSGDLACREGTWLPLCSESSHSEDARNEKGKLSLMHQIIEFNYTAKYICVVSPSLRHNRGFFFLPVLPNSKIYDYVLKIKKPQKNPLR